MITEKEVKKKVTEDWLRAFPKLSAFEKNKLYKIIGCCIAGIELIKLPHSKEYRPHFVIYSLWKNDVKECLCAPVLIRQLYNKKGLQFNIPYEKHTFYFDDAVDCFNRQFVISLSGDVNYITLDEFVDSKFNYMLVNTNSAVQARLFELKFYIALYVGETTRVYDILSQIQNASQSWNMQMFETWYGKFDLWFQGLKEKLNNRDDFLRQVDTNKRDKKLIQLIKSDLIT